MPESQPNSLKPLSPKQGLALGTLAGSFFFVIGYFLVLDKHESFGMVLFMFVPLVSGFAIAAVVQKRAIGGVCVVMTAIISLACLFALGFEGYLCCLMALPIIAIVMFIGALLGYLLVGRLVNQSNHPKKFTLLLLLTSPFLIAAADAVEKPFRRQERVETFLSEVTIAADRATIWKKLIRMSPMNGEKPFLLNVGLPVPDQCTLDSESVGGERVCHFDQGQIRQRITAWNEPSGFKVDITGSTLPGRLWLTFRDAEYELIVSKNNANETKVVRRTTISSRLYPRWYWRTFEEWGVASETEFVLSSLKKSVEEK